MKIGINLDQYTADNEYLHIICHLLHPEHEIHLISNRDEKKRSKMIEELEEHRIKFSKLIFTSNMSGYLEEQGIEMIDS